MTARGRKKGTRNLPPVIEKNAFSRPESLTGPDSDVGIIDIDGLTGEHIREGLVVGGDFVGIAADQAHARLRVRH